MSTQLLQYVNVTATADATSVVEQATETLKLLKCWSVGLTKRIPVHHSEGSS